MEKKGTGSGCCKFTAVVSVLALGGAVVSSYYCYKKCATPPEDSSFDEKVKNVVLDVVKQNPQLLMDAMGEGIARKREDTMKQLAADVLAKKDDLCKLGMKFGKSESKNIVICFFDPLCKHCISFQRSMLKIIQSGADVRFELIPVSVLGEDSVLVAKAYIAVYLKSPGKAAKFIEAVTAEDGTVDKDGMEKALKAAGVDSKDIEKLMADADAKLIENGKAAENLKIPVVPAIFHVKGQNIQMIQSTDVGQILQVIGSEKSEDAQAPAGAPADGKAAEETPEEAPKKK
jgi:protein-disulfide isomerase